MADSPLPEAETVVKMARLLGGSGSDLVGEADTSPRAARLEMSTKPSMG